MLFFSWKTYLIKLLLYAAQAWGYTALETSTVIIKTLIFDSS